jgi:hypothetical protein
VRIVPWGRAALWRWRRGRPGSGSGGVPRRVFQRLLPETPTSERCVEACYLQRTRFEGIAKWKLRRRRLTEDGNVEISGRDLREGVKCCHWITAAERLNSTLPRYSVRRIASCNVWTSGASRTGCTCSLRHSPALKCSIPSELGIIRQKFIKNVLTLCIAKYLVEFTPILLSRKAHPAALAREEIMKSSAALFQIALTLGAVTVAPWPSAQAQASRQEGPIEIEKCQTISQPGSYKLVKNLTFTGIGECLLITADFVTIDLAGFTISGGANIAFGITGRISGRRLQGIAVRNGSLSGFNRGVELGNADGSIVEGLRVVGGNTGADINGITANGIVKGNTVMSYEVGIEATGTVTGNYAASNSDVGLFIHTGSTVIGNTATDGSHFGLAVVCPANLTDNTAVNNTDGNLVVLSGNGCNNTNNVAP